MSTDSGSTGVRDGGGTDTGTDAGGRRHTAGAFDVRTIIGGLLAFFGVVLVIMGLVHNSGAEIEKAGGVNANLWTGIVLVVVGVGFLVWARVRPVVVDPRDFEGDDDRPAGH
jgi:hypothetical protein